MKRFLRKITGWLVAHIGTYYLIRIDKAQSQPQVYSTLVVRALTVRAALNAAYKACSDAKAQQGGEFVLSFIQRI